jgi:RNA polymerase sigma factor (sigma-70 family)
MDSPAPDMLTDGSRRTGAPVVIASGATGSKTLPFDELYDCLVPLLRHIATDKFHVPRADADGLVHDIFLTFLTNPTNVREVRPYLIGAICNASRKYWRRRQSDDAVFGPSDGIDEAIDMRSVDEVSVRLTVAATLARLCPRCRETLRRYYLEGESTASIAQAMETTTAYVFKLLHQCRRQAHVINQSLARVP